MTREQLIRSLGLHVVSSLRRFAPDWLERERYHLLVLGHSLELDIARDLATLARKQSPEIRIILLRRTPYSVVRCEFADAVCLPDPPALLAEISQLLGLNRGQQHPRVPTHTENEPSRDSAAGGKAGYSDHCPDVMT